MAQPRLHHQYTHPLHLAPHTWSRWQLLYEAVQRYHLIEPGGGGGGGGGMVRCGVAHVIDHSPARMTQGPCKL